MTIVQDLIRAGIFTPELMQFLQAALQARLNVLVVGADEPARLAVLNALSENIPDGETLYAIDTEPAVVLPADRAAFELDSGQLAALETPGGFLIAADAEPEALQAMLGHPGGTVLASIHAEVSVEFDWLRDAIDTVDTAAYKMMMAAIDLIIVTEIRVDDSRLHINYVAEPLVERERVLQNRIFEFEQTGVINGDVVGRLRPTGLRPTFMMRLNETGVLLPPSVFGLGRKPDPTDTSQSGVVPVEKPEAPRETEAETPPSPPLPDPQAEPSRQGADTPKKIAPQSKGGIIQRLIDRLRPTDTAEEAAKEAAEEAAAPVPSDALPAPVIQALDEALDGIDAESLDPERLNLLQTTLSEMTEDELLRWAESRKRQEPPPEDAETGDDPLVWLGESEEAAAETPSEPVRRLDPNDTQEFAEVAPEPAVPTPPTTSVLPTTPGGPPASTTKPPARRETVQFTAFHPKEAAPGTWYTFLMYMHVRAALEEVRSDAARFKQEMGGDARQVVSKRSAQLQRGTELTLRPVTEGLSFKPQAVTINWEEDVERAMFRFKADAALLDEPAVGEVRVYAGPIELAAVKFAIAITADAETEPPPDTDDDNQEISHPTNPLALAKLQRSTGHMYRRIFISYSRKDTAIARAYRLAQMAAGDEVFFDTENIRAGEDWRAALARAIDQADVFQLFWSEHSAASPNVRDEWDYALKHRCADDGCTGFIRPVYWRRPMPSPPQALRHLNFRYIPLADDDDNPDTP